jgi:glutamate dehydrogenase/leucine dehydrogenase
MIRGWSRSSYFIINAGSVITAALEHKKKSGKEAFESVSARIRKNTNLILEKGYERESPVQAIARVRTMDAMKYREY